MIHPNMQVVEQYQWLKERGFNNPWEWVQYKNVFTNGEWKICDNEPGWQPLTEYRFATSFDNGVIKFGGEYVPNSNPN